MTRRTKTKTTKDILMITIIIPRRLFLRTDCCNPFHSHLPCKCPKCLRRGHRPRRPVNVLAPIRPRQEKTTTTTTRTTMGPTKTRKLRAKATASGGWNWPARLQKTRNGNSNNNSDGAKWKTNWKIWTASSMNLDCNRAGPTQRQTLRTL